MSTQWTMDPLTQSTVIHAVMSRQPLSALSVTSTLSCSNCSGYHQKLGITKSHTLLSGDDFPTVYTAKREADDGNTIDKCPDHPKEELKFHSEKHRLVCCVACNILQHKQCEMTYIPVIDTLKRGETEKLKRGEIE